MTTKIARINQISKERPKEVFTSIYHLINKELLKECFDDLDGSKAVGLDKVTKDEYRCNLDENLDNLVERLKNKSYRPNPARKVNIPKANGKLRGLAIANFEDKIVQMSVKKILEAIFEPKFTNNMFGFRPSRGCHDCLDYVSKCIICQKTSYILDADIKGYFDNINHDKLIKCLELHIKDNNLLRLIKRFLKAGILENGKYVKGELGTPQGSILSPILANIYMYYALILWFEKVKKISKGYVEIINYADDMLICFQYEYEAKKIYEMMKTRLKQVGLEFAEDKTRLIEFGRFAEISRQKKGLGKPATFDFLGFTHYCSKSQSGKFRVKRKTSRKKFKQKVQEYKAWIKQNRNAPLEDIMSTTRKKLIGHYNYYGVRDNSHALSNYYSCVTYLLYKWLNRRSQRNSYSTDEFKCMVIAYDLPTPKIMVNI